MVHEVMVLEMHSSMSSSSSSPSRRVAGGEVLIHRLAATLPAAVEAGAVKATTAGLENRRGEGTQRGGRGGRQGQSRGGGRRGRGRGGGGLAAGQRQGGGSLLAQKPVLTEGGGEEQGLGTKARGGQACQQGLRLTGGGCQAGSKRCCRTRHSA